MKMAQTQGSSTYLIESIRTEPSVTAHLHDLGLRKGSEVIILQKNHQGGILLYQDNRIALDTSVMERIDVTPILQEKTITSLDQLVVGEEARITSGRTATPTHGYGLDEKSSPKSCQVGPTRRSD